MENYRKADPNYVGFVPKTASEAIDLFTRHRNLGVPPSQWPETFCLVSRALPDGELDLFQEWLISPQGSTGGQTYEPCPEIEAERLRLVAEADARDEDDEKLPLPEAICKGLEKHLKIGPDGSE